MHPGVGAYQQATHAAQAGGLKLLPHSAHAWPKLSMTVPAQSMRFRASCAQRGPCTVVKLSWQRPAERAERHSLCTACSGAAMPTAQRSPPPTPAGPCRNTASRFTFMFRHSSPPPPLHAALALLLPGMSCTAAGVAGPLWPVIPKSPCILRWQVHSICCPLSSHFLPHPKPTLFKCPAIARIPPPPPPFSASRHPNPTNPTRERNPTPKAHPIPPLLSPPICHTAAPLAS